MHLRWRFFNHRRIPINAWKHRPGHGHHSQHHHQRPAPVTKSDEPIEGPELSKELLLKGLRERRHVGPRVKSVRAGFTTTAGWSIDGGIAGQRGGTSAEGVDEVKKRNKPSAHVGEHEHNEHKRRHEAITSGKCAIRPDGQCRCRLPAHAIAVFNNREHAR